jgi:hypothetical protein
MSLQRYTAHEWMEFRRKSGVDARVSVTEQRPGTQGNRPPSADDADELKAEIKAIEQTLDQLRVHPAGGGALSLIVNLEDALIERRRKAFGPDIVPAVDESAGRDLMLARMQNGGKPPKGADGTETDDEPVGRDAMMATMRSAGGPAADVTHDDPPAGRDAMMKRMLGGAR